jgi:hypothetical protein
MKTILLSLIGSLSIMLYSQTITPGTIVDPQGNWCPGDSLIMPYTITGTFNPGNMFILQMSDAGGSTFTSPINVDTIISTTGGTFSSIIPMGTSWTDRRLRIISSNPGVTSSTSALIYLQFTPILNIINSGPFCLGQSFSIGADQTGNWTGPNGFIATFTDQVYIYNPTYADSGSYIVSVTNGHGCTNRDTIHVTFNIPPSVSFNYPGSDTICTWYGVQSLTGGTPLGGTYSGYGVSGNNFDPTMSGTGTMEIVYTYTAANGCSNADTTSITVLGCAGIEDNFSQRIHVYPNPFTNSITIEGIEDKQAIVTNSIGEIIVNTKITETNRTILLENLPNGIYFLRIDNRVQKLIKN